MDSKILMVYGGQGKDEMKDNKICALMDEVEKKENSFLPRPLTVFYQESRNKSTSSNLNNSLSKYQALSNLRV